MEIFHKISLTFILLIAFFSMLEAIFVYFRNTPYIIKSKYRFLAIIPIILISYFSVWNFSFIISNIVILFILIVLVLSLGMAFKNIYVFGGVEADVRDNIVKFLNEKHFEIEQIPSAIYIKKINYTLQIIPIKKRGIIQIQVTGNDHDYLINMLVKDLRKNLTEVNLSYTRFNLGIGLMFLLIYLIQLRIF